jgi:hypothetical protein
MPGSARSGARTRRTSESSGAGRLGRDQTMNDQTMNEFDRSKSWQAVADAQKSLHEFDKSQVAFDRALNVLGVVITLFGVVVMLFAGAAAGWIAHEFGAPIWVRFLAYGCAVLMALGVALGLQYARIRKAIRWYRLGIRTVKIKH